MHPKDYHKNKFRHKNLEKIFMNIGTENPGLIFNYKKHINDKETLLKFLNKYKELYPEDNLSIDDLITLLDERFKVDNKYDMYELNHQLALLIIAAIAFVIAFAINTLLHSLTKQYVETHPWQYLIYCIGLLFIGAIIIYFINKHFDNC